MVSPQGSDVTAAVPNGRESFKVRPVADPNIDPAMSFREYHGLRAVECLSLRPGRTVLDVGCGTGSVTIPAAGRVGDEGRVVAVERRERTLFHAARRAREANLRNIEWRMGHLDTLPVADDEEFDAVVCAFGIFGSPDMTTAVARLWKHVRPGGRLVLATWSERLFEPANAAFWEALRRVRPSLFAAFQPWEAIDTPGHVADLLAAAGVPAGEITEEPYEHPLLQPEDFWTIVMGSHYRGIVNQLAPLERDLVEMLTLRPISERRIEWIHAGALFSISIK